MIFVNLRSRAFFFQSCSANSSLIMTAVTLERFLAVQMPLRSRKWRTTTQAKVIILCLFLAAFTLNIPILFTARMTPVSCIAIAFKNTFTQVIEINLNIIPHVNDQFFHVRCSVGCNVGYQNRNIVQK